MKQAGIRLVTFNILGLPWSSPAGDVDTLLLNRELGSDHTRVAGLVPFPKSALTRKMMDEGFLAADYDKRDNVFFTTGGYRLGAAVEMAGTDLDLDPDLEAAGIEHLMKTGKKAK